MNEIQAKIDLNKKRFEEIKKEMATCKSEFLDASENLSISGSGILLKSTQNSILKLQKNWVKKG